MTVTRRSIVVALVQAGGLALTLGRQPAVAATCSPASDPAVAKLRSLVTDPAGARCIGQMYRRQAPAEQDPAHLASLILSSLQLSGRDPLRLRRRALAKLFSVGARADFAAGRTVILDGWMLSRTEARVCALWV
jgi:hypothetical protein